MKCVICKNGETKEGKTTSTFEENDVIIVVKSIPAMVCDTCGEAYISGETTKRLLEQVEQAMSSGTKVNICEFVAA